MWAGLVRFFSRIGFAWARRRLDNEARREFDGHLGLLVDRYIRLGMTLEEADIAARRQFGNVTLAREEIYQMNGIGSRKTLRRRQRSPRGRPQPDEGVREAVSSGPGQPHLRRISRRSAVSDD